MKRLGLPILFVLWLFFVIGSFFAVQKPFGASTAAAVGGSLANLLVAAWLCAIAFAIGEVVLSALVGGRLSGAEVFVLGIPVGLGVMGTVILGLGMAGLFGRGAAWGVTLAASVPAAARIALLARRGRLPSPKIGPGDLPGRGAAVYLSLFSLFVLSLALMPPIDWDGLFYHLKGPEIYIEAGRVVGGVDIPHLSFPCLMEMLFAWAMLLRGDIAAKLMHTLFAPLLAALVYIMAKEHFGRRAAWPAVLVFAGMPMLVLLSSWAYNDVALAFFQVASLHAFLKSRADDRLDARWLALSGVLGGFSMGLKYTAFVAPLAVGLMVLWHGARRKKNPLVDALAFALPALVVGAPWYVKNYALTGNPVYPFLHGVFGGPFWDGFRADWYSAGGTGIGLNPLDLLALPWLATLGVRDMNYWDGRTGPLFLLFLPLVLLYGFGVLLKKEERPRALSPVLFFALLQFGFWAIGVVWSRSLWQSRFLLGCLAALSPVVGWIWDDLRRFDVPELSLRRFVSVVVWLVLALTAVDQGLFITLNFRPAAYLVGAEGREEYLFERLGAHYAAMEQVNALPAGSVVLFLWEPRSYYCGRAPACRPDSILDAFPHLVYLHGDADSIAAALAEEGVTHVLVYESGLEFVLQESPDAPGRNGAGVLADFRARHLRLVSGVGEQGSEYNLYSLEK